MVGVAGGGSSFALNCLQAHDFPELPADEGSGLSIPADLLVEAIDRVARAASRDETRPVLTGVLVRLGPEGITLVATDSYRLAVRQTPLDPAPAEAVEAIVPARALTEVARLVGVMKADAVEVVLSETQALFRIGDLRLTSRVIDGQFPDHRQLVPDAFEHDVAFDRAELLAVLTRIGVLAQRNTPVRLAFAPGTVTISADERPGGRGTRGVAGGLLGEGLEMGFNVEFLRAGWRASAATRSGSGSSARCARASCAGRRMTTATSSCRSGSTPSPATPAGAEWVARRLEVADVRCWDRAASTCRPAWW